MGNPFTYCVVSFRLPKLKMDGFTCFSFSPLGAAACGMCVRYPAAKSPTWSHWICLIAKAKKEIHSLFVC